MRAESIHYRGFSIDQYGDGWNALPEAGHVEAPDLADVNLEKVIDQIDEYLDATGESR